MEYNCRSRQGQSYATMRRGISLSVAATLNPAGCISLVSPPARFSATRINAPSKAVLHATFPLLNAEACLRAVTIIIWLVRKMLVQTVQKHTVTVFQIAVLVVSLIQKAS
jgi:hypothetical protein